MLFRSPVRSLGVRLLNPARSSRPGWLSRLLILVLQKLNGKDVSIMEMFRRNTATRGDITGISLLAGDYNAKWLGLLKQLLPNLHRVAVLRNPDGPSIAKEVEQMRMAARALGIDLTAFFAKRGDIEDSFTAISNGGYEGLVVTTDPFSNLILPALVL